MRKQGENLNLRQKTNRSIWHNQRLEVPWTTTFKTRFAKLDLLKAVAVFIIVNNEKMEIKKSFNAYIFRISSPSSPFCFFCLFFKKLTPRLTHYFAVFISFLFKKRRGIGNYVHSPKNLRNSVCQFLRVSFGTFWYFLYVFTDVGYNRYGDMVFYKDFCTFLWTN